MNASGAGDGDTYCRNCGVRLRRFLGRWRHAQQVGFVRCDRPEPEAEPTQAVGNG